MVKKYSRIIPIKFTGGRIRTFKFSGGKISSKKRKNPRKRTKRKNRRYRGKGIKDDLIASGTRSLAKNLIETTDSAIGSVASRIKNFFKGKKKNKKITKQESISTPTVFSSRSIF